MENKEIYKSTNSIEEPKEKVKDINELVERLADLIEQDNKYSFEWSCGGTMEIYDKEKQVGYVLHVAQIEYDENGEPVNL